MNRVFLPLAVLLSSLMGCDAQAPEPAAPGPIERQGDMVAYPQITQADVGDRTRNRWLSVRDARDPIEWLAGFDEAPVADKAGRRAALRHVIAELDARYLEDPRMLANRTVQLHNMLEEIDVHEDMLGLLQGFATLTRGQEGREDQFGEKIAYYVHLRGTGASHRDAFERIEAGSSAGAPQGLPPGAR